MATLTNHTNLPEVIVQAVTNDPYDPGDSQRTLTELIGPPKLATLRRALADELAEDVADRLYALEGQVMHGILERAGRIVGDRVEERLYAHLGGWHISGQFDNVRLGGDALTDWKYTSVFSCKGDLKPEHVAQTNGQAWLLAENDHPAPTQLFIGFYARDWRPGEAERDDNYPPKVHLRPVPAWSLDETRAYLTSRVQIHQMAQEAWDRKERLPDCTDAERWKDPNRFAVTKPDAPRALKLWDTVEEAEADQQRRKNSNELVIELRPGRARRCRLYCLVGKNNRCKQFRAEGGTVVIGGKPAY